MKVLIDISNIIPGKGGSGGGVWIYSMNLLEEMDRTLERESLTVTCFKNKENKELQLSSINIVDSPFSQKGILGRLFWVHLYLPFYCLKNRIDIVHRVVPELPLISFSKSVCTLHDLMFKFYLDRPRLLNYLGSGDKFKFKIFNVITRLAVRSADFVLVPSATIKKEVEDTYADVSEKVVVTLEAVAKKEVIIQKPAGDSTLFRIIVVAGFYPHKGYMYVLQTARALLDSGLNDFLITLRGNPAFSGYMDDIKKAIQSMGLTKHVQFANFVKLHQLADIYAGQDAFLLLSEYEGFGLPVLEAQQFGVPVLCADTPVFRELLQDSAIYLDLDNPSTSSQQIIDLMQHVEKRSALRAKGFDNVQSFSWARMAAQTVQVYKRLQ